MNQNNKAKLSKKLVKSRQLDNNNIISKLTISSFTIRSSKTDTKQKCYTMKSLTEDKDTRKINNLQSKFIMTT